MGRISVVPQPQKRDVDAKLAQTRLSVLELAKEHGNVAEACRPRAAWTAPIARMARALPDPGLRGPEGPAADP